MSAKTSLKEFIEYREKLKKCRENRSSELLFNDSDIHEEFVLKEFFIHAVTTTPKTSTIYMYCGSMSAFRDAMQGSVDRTKAMLRPIDNPTTEEMDEWNNFNPYSKMIEAMNDYFNAGGRLEVIVDDDISSLKNETIWRDTLSRYYHVTKQLSVNRLMVDCGIEHFVVSGNAYRSEISHADKTAICCFNNPDYAKMLYSNYLFLMNYSKQVAI